MGRLFKKSWMWMTVVLSLILGLGIYVFVWRTDTPKQRAPVISKDLNVTLDIKGEIKSSKTGVILLPPSITDASLRIWNIEISDMVEEGKRVKKGDFIALLAPATIQSKIQDNQDKLAELETGLEKKKIDNEIQLDDLKKGIELMDYDIESAKLDVEQSVYESEAYQRKAKVAYERLLRKREVKERNYQRTELYLKQRYQVDERKYKDGKELQRKLELALKDTRIVSPADGMVMYVRDYSGKKRGKGDMLDPWNAQIATLPDLSKLTSEIYLDEVYISKIHLGDSVQVTIDALKGYKLMGAIRYIANVGQDMKSHSSKVFRVEIEIHQSEKLIMPYMTTSNLFTLDH